MADVFAQRYTSVVLDMSQVPEPERHPYLERLASVIDRFRAASGLPHWIINDEAHSTATKLRSGSALLGGTRSTGKWGFCLATFRPDLIEAAALAQIDAVVVMGNGEDPSPELTDLLANTSHLDRSNIFEVLSGMESGSAYLAVRPDLGPSTPFRVASRLTQHRRHWLSNCPIDVIEHHAKGHDLSSWMERVFRDSTLADALARIEDQVCSGTVTSSQARPQLVRCISRRYAVE